MTDPDEERPAEEPPPPPRPPAPPPAIRVDPLTGAQVIITASRQHRPNEGPGSVARPADPGLRGPNVVAGLRGPNAVAGLRGPNAVAGLRGPNVVAGCPFCPGGREAPEPYDVRWFVNRWPAMDGDRCEVILYTPDHHASFAGLGQDGARRVVDLWAERTAALGARDDVAYVLVFENRGAEVGATIAHPHGQIYAFAEVPPVPARELSADPCPLCDETAEGRLVAEARSWRAWVPAAATWPFAVTLAPVAHRADLPTLTDGERDAMAALLVDVLGRLDRLFDAPMPYFLWIHQRPTDGRDWPNAHLHVEICPLYRAPGTPRFVASGELGSGVFFNPIAPEEAAARLRDVAG